MEKAVFSNLIGFANSNPFIIFPALNVCYKGKIDMIIVKSISRFAWNTLDVIKITRKLREINVDVYFEEQGIHSIDPASEFYITIYGSIAQSESENISANVKWGKAQSAKQGNVPFQCKHFLGYTKNADGEIEIVPEEAEIIREIYERYLSGESLHGIKCYLEAKEIPTPAGCSVWRQETIRSILSNEKYKGDAIADGIDEERITELMNEKQGLTVQLEQYATMRQKRENAKSRLDEIFTILDGLQNHPMEYDDTLVRQIIECVVVESKEKIKVVFIGGTEIEMTL